jgi:outer membrane immunogenic protein
MTASATAADLAARPYTKAPPPIVAPNWTGFYIFGGGGVENSLDIFGIHMPGLFMKTEYRAAYYDRISLPETSVATGLPNGFATTFNPWVQTVSTSLVYRFGWNGPTRY